MQGPPWTPYRPERLSYLIKCMVSDCNDYLDHVAHIPIVSRWNNDPLATQLKVSVGVEGHAINKNAVRRVGWRMLSVLLRNEIAVKVTWGISEDIGFAKARSAWFAYSRC